MSRSLIYVEIDVDYCSLVYGTAPCTATLVGEDATGEIKCFNSLDTCQDRPNFDNAPVTLRFGKAGVDYAPADIDAIANLNGVEFEPGRVSLGEDLGQRASVQVTFRDHPHGDTGEGFDKYLSDRSYDPFDLGTFWGKFRARQPFVRGRALRVKHGFEGDALADFETRYYVIDSFDGPTPDGQYVITAKDPLKLADADRAQAPVLSNGFLASDISAVASSATLSPSGVGDDEYPASGFVAIGGKEVCAFTRSSDVLTFDTADSPPADGRAQQGTVAQAHNLQDAVQLCLSYSAQDPGDIIRDLLINYADVPSTYIDQATWNTETNAFLARLYTGFLAEPSGVRDLVSEIIQQAGLAIWWDDLDQEIRLQVLRGVQAGASSIDEDNTLEGSLRSKEQPETRLSQVWTRFGQIDPLQGLDDSDNYRSAAATVETDKEADYGSPSIKNIFSRWIPAGGRAIATKLNDVLLARFKDPPRVFNFSLFRTGPLTPELGQVYQLSATSLQDETGAAAMVPVQIKRVNVKEDRFEVEAEEMLYEAPANLGNRVIIIDTDQNNLNLRVLHDQLYPTPTGGVTVVCIIQPGVVVGSVDAAIPSFTLGNWPTTSPEITIVVQCLGRSQGLGGAGGRGGQRGGLNGVAGGPGGAALYTRVNVKLDTSAGEVWGGAGGGGGGGGQFNETSNKVSGGSGGGGGAGTEFGDAGAAGTHEHPFQFPTAGTAGTSELGGDGGPDPAGVAGPGGDGGDPGENGAAGGAATGGSVGGDVQGDGGASALAGAAIDGSSFVTLGTWDAETGVFTPGETMTEDIRGPEVN